MMDSERANIEFDQKKILFWFWFQLLFFNELLRWGLPTFGLRVDGSGPCARLGSSSGRIFDNSVW